MAWWRNLWSLIWTRSTWLVITHIKDDECLVRAQIVVTPSLLDGLVVMSMIWSMKHWKNKTSLKGRYSLWVIHKISLKLHLFPLLHLPFHNLYFGLDFLKPNRKQRVGVQEAASYPMPCRMSSVVWIMNVSLECLTTDDHHESQDVCQIYLVTNCR